MIQHLIHSSFLAVLLYGVYYLFLRKETFFQWNRFYLLSIPLLSVGAPLIHILLPFELNQVVGNNLSFLSPVIINSTHEIPNEVSSAISLSLFVLIIYCLGVIVSALLLVLKIINISKLIRTSSVTAQDRFKIVSKTNTGIACSFFNFIFIDESLGYITNQEIIKHEEIHVLQKHSYDLFYYELIRVFIWFHPVAYIAQNELKKIHEYIVDAQLIENNETKEYQSTLLKNALGCHHLSLSHPFYKSSILKNRIIMLQKSKSTPASILKIAIIIPFLLTSVLYTSCNQDENLNEESNIIEEIIEVKEINSGTIDPNAELIIEDVPFAIIEKVPHFEECTGTNAEMKKCTSDKITSIVNKNFNTGLAKDLSGRHKISVQFKIDKNGNVVGVQSNSDHSQLKDEAARVINLLPKMVPGKQRGQAINTIYALPIIFEIKE